jgi:hypothetical protein
MNHITDMTLDELEAWMDKRISQRLTALFSHLEVDSAPVLFDEEPDTRTWEQVKHDIEQDRWTPPTGAKTSLEFLREDRDA